MSSETRSGMQTFLVTPALILAAGLVLASGGSSSPLGCRGHAAPSNFDYLVLASIADSPRLTALASYQPRPRPGAAGAFVSPSRKQE